MGGGACVIIIEGTGAQGNADKLIRTLIASCDLVGYLSLDDDVEFKDEDTEPIVTFHRKAIRQLFDLNKELEKLNEELAAKYNREVGY